MENPSLSENDFARLDYYFAKTSHRSEFLLACGGRSTPDSSCESHGSSQQSINDSYDIELIGDASKTELQKKYKIPKPRILRNDFRRFYANMWVNVFNSCSSSLVNEHLHTFYSPNVGVVQADMRYDRMVHPQEIPMYQEKALGLGYLGKFWYAGMCIAPDIVCSLRHTMLKVRSDGTSAIKCAFVLKGTMVSNLNDGKQADVEKIARYQKLRDSGRTDIRDITFTEAAMVAVAPPTIVAVPGGRAEMLSNTPVMQNIKTNHLSSSTLATSDMSMSSPREAAAVTLKREPGAIYLKTPIQLSCDSMDSAISEDNRSTSSASMLSAGSAPSPSPSPSLLSAARKRRHRAAVSGAMEVASEAKKSTSSMLGAGNQGRSPKATMVLEGSTLEAAAKHQINWLSVAESAFEAGVLQPCQAHSAKEYYHAEESPPPTASHMLQEHVSRTRSRSDEVGDSSSAMDVVEVPDKPTIELVSPPENTEESKGDISMPVSAPTGKKIVLTAKIDCICSLELELDKDSVIVGVAVNYFR